jgi:predicted nucleic acid-binding protein
MKTVVIDASVVVKLYFEEEHSKAAEQCVARAGQLLAPDLLWAETANVIWKRHRRGDLAADAAIEIAEQVLAMPVTIHPSSGLIPDALDLAVRLDRTVYDCMYLALAVRTKAVLVTADKRLVNALAGSPLEKYVALLGSPYAR